MTTTQPTRLQTWILASRPKTLPAAVAPVAAATALAFQQHTFRAGPALAALLGALLLQIGANLANDVFDFQKGADTAERMGPMRVTQAGLLTPREVKTGMWVTFGLAALVGLYLVFEAGWVVVAIGLASIAAAILYTGGPYPLGYNGLGEIFVFLFFGLAAVCGTYYVQARQVTLTALLVAVPVGLLIVALLVVNNLRDVETDRKTGKRTLPARFGANFARLEYLACLGVAYLIVPGMILGGLLPAWALLSWGSLLLVPDLIRRIYRTSGKTLNVALAGTSRLGLVFSLLLGAGLVISALL